MQSYKQLPKNSKKCDCFDLTPNGFKSHASQLPHRNGAAYDMLLGNIRQSFKNIMMWNGFFAVGTGAACGAWLRWGLGVLLNPLFPTLPLGTLCANLLGGYLIGLVLGIISLYDAMPIEMRLLIVTGFLGGLTTFSTFSAEVVTLFLRQQYVWAVGSIVLHLFGSLSLTLMGMATINLLRP